MTSAPGHQASAGGPITFINVLEVPAERVGEFIAQWRAGAQIMAAAPGFRDATLHQAVSSQTHFQLVNVAHWDSQAQQQAAESNPAFRDRPRDPELLYRASPGVYTIAMVQEPRSPEG